MKKLLSVIIALIMTVSSVVTAMHVSAASGDFSDVAENRWSYGSVTYAVKMGYMNGVGGGKFDPEGSLTRAMVATVLWRREGSPAPSAPSGFADVPANEWYADADHRLARYIQAFLYRGYRGTLFWHPSGVREI